jgi:uncharacterized membrane protein YfcA
VSDLIGAVLALEGLVPLLMTTLFAGVVYGFAGFGSGLVFLPVATVFISPQLAIASFALTTIGSALTVLPPAWAETDKPRTLTLVLPAFLSSFLGVYLLRILDPITLRWGISLLVGGTLLALMFGWRRKLQEGRAALLAVGAGAGLLGGATGLLGPVVILFNLSGQHTARQMRANTLSFLTIMGLLMMPVLWLQGLLPPTALVLGALLTPAYALGTVLGQRLFRPQFEGLYRVVGYGVVAIAVLVGLPIWG